MYSKIGKRVQFAEVTLTQQARKFKKVQAKKLVKSNKSDFFHEIAFLGLAIFEIAIFFVKLILFIRVFLAWTFLNFLA